MVPTFASYGSENESEEILVHRPLLHRPKRVQVALALLSASLVIASGAGAYGSFEKTRYCQNPLATESLETFFPRSQHATTERSLGAMNATESLTNLFSILDKDENGAVNLTELVNFLQSTVNEQVHSVQMSASSSVAWTNQQFLEQATCIATAFESLIKGDAIYSEEELLRVLNHASEHCHDGTMQTIEPIATTRPPFPVDNTRDTIYYTREEIMQYVKEKTNSVYFLQCTLDALDQFPGSKRFTKQDLDSVMTAVLQCLKQWFTRCKSHESVGTFG